MWSVLCESLLWSLHEIPTEKPNKGGGKKQKEKLPRSSLGCLMLFSVSASSTTTGMRALLHMLKDALLCCSSFDVIVHDNFGGMLKVTMP